MKKSNLDVVIIGGGPAGMSAALVAGRALLRAVVVNAQTPRNAVTTASHGFLTRDGAHPLELLEAAKEQLQKYSTVRCIHGSVLGARAHSSGFVVELTDGATLSAERVIIATGYRNDLARLRLPGIEAVYGKTVYPCVFCDGFEHRGERLAVFSNSGEDFYVPMVRMWTEDITIFTNGTTMKEEQKRALERRGVGIIEEPVARLISSGGSLQAVELESGRRVERDAGFISDDHSVPATRFAEDLGVSKTHNDWGMEVLDTDPTGRSSVPGVYVVGDARIGFGGLVASAAEGAACAEGIVHEIAKARWAEEPGRQQERPRGS